jgi:hypothetical protein
MPAGSLAWNDKNAIKPTHAASKDHAACRFGGMESFGDFSRRYCRERLHPSRQPKCRRDVSTPLAAMTRGSAANIDVGSQ